MNAWHALCMSVFYSVDPGRVAGWARWEDGRLVSCGLLRTKAKAGDVSTQAQEQRAALAAAGWVPGVPVVCEMAVWRGGKKGSMMPNTLGNFNLVAGALGTEWVPPHEWKGLVPKEEHQPRIWGVLAQEEQALLARVKPAGMQHNTVDAVGIGLWRLGRLGVDKTAVLAEYRKKRGIRPRKARKVRRR